MGRHQTYAAKRTARHSPRGRRRAGVWDQIMEALTVAHDAAVQMIDTSVVRAHQHGACIAGNREQHMGRSRGGLTSKQGAWANIPPKVNRKDPSASALISTGRVTWWSGSSTRSSNAGISPPAMTSSQPITSPSSCLLRSVFGCVLMSPRPSGPRRSRRSLTFVILAKAGIQG